MILNFLLYINIYIQKNQQLRQIKKNANQLNLQAIKFLKTLDKSILKGYNYCNNCDEDGRYTKAMRDTAVGASRKRCISEPFTFELEKGKSKDE